MFTTSMALRRAAGIGLLALLTSTAGLAAAAAPAAAAGTDRYVATDGQDSDNSCTVQDSPCATIGHAVFVAGDGDTIHIASGQYDESIEVSTSLTFVGAGASGPGKTVVDGDGESNTFDFGSDGDVIDDTIQNIAVDGNTSSDAVRAEGNVNLHVTDSSVSDNEGDGIDALFGVSLDVSDSTVSNNDGDGIFGFSGVTVALTSSTVSNNANHGVDLGSQDTTATISESTIDENGRVGVLLHTLRDLAKRPAGVRTPNVDGPPLAITDTTVTENGDSGVDVELGPVLGDTKAAAATNATVQISSSDISDNGDSGVFTTADTSISGSTLNHNAAYGIRTESSAALTVDTSTFDANTGAGLDLEGGAAVVSTSTISDTVPFEVEGGSFEGGGIEVFGGTLALSDSTLVGNSGQGVLSQRSTVTVDSSTISGTKPSQDESYPSGGLVQANVTDARSNAKATGNAATAHVRAAAVTPSLTVTSSIVADQYKSTVPDCGSEVTDGGYNLSSDGANSCGFTDAQHDLSQTDPQLGDLGDNGGPTQTELVAKGSPAVDVIPAGESTCQTDSADQRGVSRPQGAKCDIGAVEAKQPPVVISPDSLPHGKVGHAYSATLTATGGLGAPYEFSLSPDSGPLPAGLSLTSGGTISGTPTEAGTFPITVSVDDPTLKDYTIVIAAAPSTSTTPPPTTVPSSPSPSAPDLSNTGANVSPLTLYGSLAVLLGLLLTAGGIARYAGRHRAH